MVDVFLVMVLLMAGLTLAESDPKTPEAERRQSDTSITEDAETKRAASASCATPAAHWRDLSTLDRMTSAGGVREEGAADER